MNNKEIKELVEALDFVHHVREVVGLGGANGTCVQVEAHCFDTAGAGRKVEAAIHAVDKKVRVWPQIVQYREVKSEEERAKALDKKEGKQCCGGCK